VELTSELIDRYEETYVPPPPPPGLTLRLRTSLVHGLHVPHDLRMEIPVELAEYFPEPGATNTFLIHDRAGHVFEAHCNVREAAEGTRSIQHVRRVELLPDQDKATSADFWASQNIQSGDSVVLHVELERHDYRIVDVVKGSHQ
jgi:hypothetical protein